jgi:eukaryotic-like serine/threonine-protein kinase
MPSANKGNCELQMTNDELKPKIGKIIRLSFHHLLLLSFVLLLFTSIRAQSTSTWPMFRGSSALTGISLTELPQPLKLRWTFQAKDSIESSAAIVDGVIYVGSMDASLYAVDLATGKLRWRYATGGPVQDSSPCVQDGVAYIGDLNGVLHAVNVKTGNSNWTFKTESEIKSSPNCAKGKVYFGSYDQNLYCLSSSSGALIWKYTTEGPLHSSPAIYNEQIYISGCDEIFRSIDVLTGKRIYELPLGAYTGASVAVRDDHAFVGTFGNTVIGINLKKREAEWVYSHPTRSFPFNSSAAITDDRVVLGGRDKMVHCLDRISGKAIWTFLTRARVESSPLILKNRVFIGSNDGLLYELDLKSGRKNWSFTAGAPLSASPAAAQECLVIGSQDGQLYCFGK